ncbi:uncharacterized protein BO72DRAFT_447084, partial [Aspergillus fijiensis CBS 313.89]
MRHLHICLWFGVWCAMAQCSAAMTPFSLVIGDLPLMPLRTRGAAATSSLLVLWFRERSRHGVKCSKRRVIGPCSGKIRMKPVSLDRPDH